MTARFDSPRPEGSAGPRPKGPFRPARALLVPALLLVAAAAGPTAARIPETRTPIENLSHANAPAEWTCLDGHRPSGGWARRVERVRSARAALRERGGVHAAARADGILTGTMKAAVFCVKYAGTGADPYPVSVLQTKLFDGPFSPQTLTQFYQEISYGHFSVEGEVFGWYQLPESDTYYEGGAGCLGTCATAKVIEMVRTVIAAYDDSVDFGAFDNDGPDGIPNSGDDDGVVDVAAFVYPERGPVCGGIYAENIRPQMRSFTYFGLSPLATDDAAANGGTILVDDYTIQSGLACDGTPDGIGEFAHEFGHVLGLRDLYDANGGTAGIGFWGLMGTGRFLTPAGDLPSHMIPWTKAELGWLDPIRVGGRATDFQAPPVEFSPTAYRLDVMHERWRRSADCVAGTGYAMRCGLTAAEAAARNWGGGVGYGNGWMERVSHEFTFDGSGPVTLAYDYACDTEEGYDFVYGVVETSGAADTFAVHTGIGSGPAVVDLTPHLAAPGQYTISFVFVSDGAWSDEDYDGIAYLQDTGCAPFAFDNVTLTGGGQQYMTGFENREDGWWCDMSDPSEYFLVELRTRAGSDAAIPGPGFLVWHIDQDVSESLFGNSGGYSELLPHGSALEQADGRWDLETLANRADDGDPFPGATSNLVFDGTSDPDSRGYGGAASYAAMTVLGAVGDPTPVRLRGGWEPPGYATHYPESATADSSVMLFVVGSGFVHGMEARLEHELATVAAQSVRWIGKDYVIAEFQLPPSLYGPYDLVLTNPGGGAVTVSDALAVGGDTTGAGHAPTPPGFALRRCHPNPFRGSTTVSFALPEPSEVEVTVYDVAGRLVRRLSPRFFAAAEQSVTWDGRDDRGRPASPGMYFIRVAAEGHTGEGTVVLLN